MRLTLQNRGMHQIVDIRVSRLADAPLPILIRNGPLSMEALFRQYFIRPMKAAELRKVVGFITGRRFQLAQAMPHHRANEATADDQGPSEDGRD